MNTFERKTVLSACSLPAAVKVYSGFLFCQGNFSSSGTPLKSFVHDS
jgi:hypothetical protein